MTLAELKNLLATMPAEYGSATVVVANGDSAGEFLEAGEVSLAVLRRSDHNPEVMIRAKTNGFRAIIIDC